MPRMTAKKPGKPRPGKPKKEVGENGLPSDEMMDPSTAMEVADAPPELAVPESAVAERSPAAEQAVDSALERAPQAESDPARTAPREPQREKRPDKHQRRAQPEQRQ